MGVPPNGLFIMENPSINYKRMINGVPPMTMDTCHMPWWMKYLGYYGLLGSRLEPGKQPLSLLSPTCSLIALAKQLPQRVLPEVSSFWCGIRGFHGDLFHGSLFSSMIFHLRDPTSRVCGVFFHFFSQLSIRCDVASKRLLALLTALADLDAEQAVTTDPMILRSFTMFILIMLSHSIQHQRILDLMQKNILAVWRSMTMTDYVWLYQRTFMDEIPISR